MFNSSPFENNPAKEKRNPEVIFVSDMFVSDYVGGAELTSQAIIDSSPFEVAMIHAKNVSEETIANYSDKYWVFGNFSSLEPSLVRLASQVLNYSVLEYDYKICRYRSPEKHLLVEGAKCDCPDTDWGDLIKEF